MLVTISRQGFDAVAVSAFEAESRSKRECLMRTSAFQALPPAQLQKLTYYLKPFTVPPRERFVNLGDDLDALYIITDGECRMLPRPPPPKARCSQGPGHWGALQRFTSFPS